MKKILIPTDFTEASLTALKIACNIAKTKRNIVIRLSHVYKVPRVPSVTNTDYGWDVRAQKKILDDLHAKLHKIAALNFTTGVKIETQLIPHKQLGDLIDHKDNKNADLIICGIHGNKEWKASWEGSNTEEIIRRSHCPVLTVNKDIKESNRFYDIVFASDFSEEMHASFPALKKVFDAFGGTLHLVKIITPHNFDTTLHVENQMKDFAKKFYLTNYTTQVFNETNVELGIHRYAYSINANLIAMETHGQKGIFHYLKGSILEAVAHHSDLPVLSMKIENT